MQRGRASAQSPLARTAVFVEWFGFSTRAAYAPWSPHPWAIPNDGTGFRRGAYSACPILAALIIYRGHQDLSACYGVNRSRRGPPFLQQGCEVVNEGAHAPRVGPGLETGEEDEVTLWNLV